MSGIACKCASQVFDDHAILRAGVRDLLDSLSGYEVVGETGTAHAVLEIIESERPDIVVMDVGLPGMDGIVATREVLRRAPNARVIVLSAYNEPHEMVDAFNAGAVGYVLKRGPARDTGARSRRRRPGCSLPPPTS